MFSIRTAYQLFRNMLSPRDQFVHIISPIFGVTIIGLGAVSLALIHPLDPHDGEIPSPFILDNRPADAEGHPADTIERPMPPRQPRESPPETWYPVSLQQPIIALARQKSHRRWRASRKCPSRKSTWRCDRCRGGPEHRTRRVA